MKLSLSDPFFVLFHTEVLDDTDDEAPTQPNIEPASPFEGLFEYASEVRIRAAVRAEKVAQRRRGA